MWKHSDRVSGDSQCGSPSAEKSILALTFEEALFTIAPSAIFLSLAPFYIRNYMRLAVIKAETPHTSAKRGALGLLIALHISSAVLCASPDGSTSTFVTSTAMACFSVLALSIFTHVEHRAREPSRLPGVYLLVTLFLDIAKAASYFTRFDAELYSAGCVTACIAATKAVLIALRRSIPEHQLRREQLRPQRAQSDGSVLDNIFVAWVRSNLLLGFRNFLTLDDLPKLYAGFTSASLAAIFKPVWRKHKTLPFALMIATFWSQLWSFLVVVPFRCLFAAIVFAEPLLLRHILKQIGRSRENPELLQSLIGNMAMLRLGLTITRACVKNLNGQTITKVRGTLISQIFCKSLLLGPHEAKRSNAANLMSSDVEGIVNSIPILHELWASFLEIVISIYLLSSIVSHTAFLMLLPAIAAWALALKTEEQLIPARESWEESVENRVSVTSRLLTQLRAIKMIGAEVAVGDYLQLLHQREVGYCRNVRMLTTWISMALTLTYASTPIVLIAGAVFWGGFKDGFNAADTCAVLAFSYISARPMAAIINSSRRLRAFIASFDRIESFLLLEERVDNRVISFVSIQKDPPHDVGQFPIQLLNATISSPDGRALFTIDLAFELATTTMVIGPTGVGKSTLLRALLGEANVTSGFIYVQPQQIAYCAEEEWICNITIRDNIIGENPYEEEWYNTVVMACLLQDIREFPYGDLTLAGLRGSNLSGGQRQRLSLARAAYTRAKIVVLDNVLRALDRQSSSAILKQLLGDGGIFKSLGSTVIMTTDSEAELLKSADRVLVIQANGSVTVQSPQQAIKRYEGKGFLDDFEDDSEDISDGGSRDDSPARHYTPPSPVEPVDTRLRRAEDLAPYKTYMKSVSTVVFVSWLLLAIVLALTERGPDIYMQLWVDNDPSNKSMFIGYAVFGMSTVLVAVIWCWQYFMLLAPDSAGYFHRALINSVTQATLSFLTYADSEALLSRFHRDMALVLEDVSLGVFYFTYNVFGLAVVLLSLAFALQHALAIIPSLLIGLYVIKLYYLRISRQLRRFDTEAKNSLYNHLTECSEGIHHIRAFQWEQQFLSKGLELLDISQKPFYQKSVAHRWLYLMLDIAASAIGIIFVALAVNHAESTNQAAIGLGLLKVHQLDGFLMYFVNLWVDLDIDFEVLSRVRAFENDTPQEGLEAGADGTLNVPESWPHHGEIELGNVSADHTIDGRDYRALHEISVEIAAGAKVALVGRPGSGRSSLLLTILNLLKFTGSITIDGIDIRTIPRQVLRSRITTISQDLLDMPGSVRDNLVPQEIMEPRESRIGDERLLNALQKVGLRKKVEDCGGLDTAVENVAVSSGERQLLALARALVHHSKTNGKVIFIEEATHYIDYECEEKLREVTEETFQDCTVLTIAHRHHTLQSATNFLELSEGHLASYE